MDLQRLFDSADGCCMYCLRMPTLWNRLSLDHIVPLARGGQHAPQNWAVACGECNSSKQDREPDEWMMRKFGAAGVKRLLGLIESRADTETLA